MRCILFKKISYLFLFFIHNIKMRGNFFVIIFCLLSKILFSQTANNYAVSTGTGGTIRAPGWTQIIGNCQDDGVSAVQSIGFTFVYEGINYTQFSVNSNGLIKLGGTAITGEWSNNAISTENRPKLMPCWEDMHTGASGYVRFGVSGTSPNRICTIEMNQLSHIDPSTCDEINYMRVQTNLYEGSNIIEFVYIRLNSTTNFSNWIYCWGNADIGIGGANASNYLIRNHSTNHTFDGTSEGSGVIIERWPSEQINLENTRRWYKFTPPSVAPVSLLNFNANCINKNVKLDWQTASEINNDYFDLERSADGNSYGSLLRVNGNGTTNEPHQYFAYDEQPLGGSNYYRLKQVDFNGSTTYYNPIIVNCNQVEGISIYPNPNNGSFIVSGISEEEEIQLTDALGRTLLSKKGEMNYELNNLQEGIYFVIIKSKFGLVQTQKIVVQR